MGYEILWEPPSGVVKRHYGQVTGQALLEAVLKVEGDKRFDRLRYVINDFSACTGVSVSESELEEIAAIDKAAFALNPNILIAMVSTQPDAVAAANGYAESPLNCYVTCLFDTMPQARSWLETELRGN